MLVVVVGADEASRAAEFLMKRYDVAGPGDDPKGPPKMEPDGVWHAPELATYVNASKRPEGEDLSLTVRNMMIMMDRDKSSSVELTE